MSSTVLIETVPVVAHENIFERKDNVPISDKFTKLAVKWCLASSKRPGHGTPAPSKNCLMIKENVIEASGTTAASWRATSGDDDPILRYEMKSVGEVILEVQGMLRSISEPPSTRFMN
jgi:hypothetical protein